ncbi:MAG: tRNA (adenosine(37)-N6)-threonylcarbamoyltransferase complex dimerization subunit type 1 TsaB [Symploca sp. SIO2E9]|nr:tRNA (adenosine(37)-N6)-threonylcarbamoyltransferase complex dimerization subunit type 1 TsaB [Symploca sp. SIO2E9]
MASLKLNKYALALHTTSPQLGLAISNFADHNRCQTWDLGRDLSSQLHQHLVDFIKPQTWEDLEFIAVAKGPGSFTSTRIGMVTARTLAQQLDIPLLAISTLAAFAWLKAQEMGQWGEFSLTNPGETINIEPFKTTMALQMPAQRGQLFTAIYQVSSASSSLIELQADAVMMPDIWQEALHALEMPYQLLEVPVNLGSSVISLLGLASLDWQQGKRPQWSEALPFYGQHAIN